MKVKCINIYNENTKQYQETDSHLSIGKEYIVLAIEIYKDEILYLLVGDNPDKSPILYNALQFEVISGKIPKNWFVITGKIQLFTIAPHAWQKPGFWDACYEYEPEALEIYRREARMIYEEEEAL